MSLENEVRTYGMSQKVFEKKLQEKYQRLVRNFRVYEIEDLVKRTGIKPDVKESEVQEAYHGYIQTGCIFESQIKMMEKLTGIMPKYDPEKMQAIYHQIASKGQPQRISELEAITKVAASEDVIRAYLLAK